jgi:hypothetical protein
LRDSFTLQTLDKTGQYEFLNTKADGLLASLQLERDPATIASLRNQLNSILSQAFGLLDPAQQKDKLADFLNRTGVVENAATTSLNAADKTIRDDFNVNDPDSTASQLTNVITTAAREAGEILKGAASQAGAALVDAVPKEINIGVKIVQLFVPEGFSADVNVSTAYATGAGGQ